jgi:hypothetical protein
VDLQWADVPLLATSDADGRFTLGGLPRDRRVTLVLSDPRSLTQEVYVATTAAPQPPLRDEWAEKTAGRKPGRGQDRPVPVHNFQFTATLRPGYRLRGQVVGADTGRPVVGARLAVRVFPPDQLTDADARFTLGPLPAGKFTFWVFPPEGSAYLSTKVQLDLRGESGVIEHTVKLPRGIFCTGQVVAEDTGKGVRGAKLRYYSKAAGDGAEVATDADGRFRLPVAPGKGQVILSGVPKGYLAENGGNLFEVGPSRFREIEAGPSQAPPDLKFTLSRGMILTGRALDQDGKPVRVSRIETLMPLDLGGNLGWESQADGAFRVSGLPRDTSYALALYCKERRLAVWFNMPAPAAQEKLGRVEVRLQPLASLTGRVVGEDGRPLAGITVRLNAKLITRMVGGANVGAAPAEPGPATSDAQGRFTFTGLLPDWPYRVRVYGNGYARYSADERMIPSGPPFAHPDVVLPRADQAVAGVVVDRAGRPLVGVEIQSRYLSGKITEYGASVRTDVKGRFRITGLPRGNVQLSATVPWEKQRYLPPLRVQAGDQDVRYQLDVSQP